MIFSILNQYKRLSWFIGIPSSILGILFLVRFFFLSKNESVSAPGVLSPNNPIHYSGLKSFTFSDMENQLDSLRNLSRNQDERKIVPLKMPKEDSLKLNPFNNPIGKEATNSFPTSNYFPENQMVSFGKKRNKAEPEFYEPGLEEVRKYQLNAYQDHKESRNSEFNSYAKPDKPEVSTERLSSTSQKIKTRIVGDQTVTDGSEIQLRTLEDFQIQGIKIPKNTLVNGEISIEEDRIFCKINSIKFDNQELETHFISQGLDKKMGLRVNDLSGNRKVAKTILGETKNQVIHDIGQQVASSVPFGSTLVPNSLRSLPNSSKKVEFRFKDESEIYFLSN